MVSLAGWLVLLLCLRVIVHFLVLIAREDRERIHRPHPTRDEGGGSFGDTSYWGGSGRPGS
jgi:hypothetical protein